jgi:hypothetical protein
MRSRLSSAARPVAVLAGALGMALASASGAAGAVRYESESEALFQQQLAARQIRSAIVNRHLRSVRLTLRDGRHVVVSYPKHQWSRLRAQLHAKHVAVTILTPAQAAKETKKLRHHHRHHKLRYIAGAVLVAVIVVLGAVVLIRWRRRLD